MTEPIVIDPLDREKAMRLAADVRVAELELQLATIRLSEKLTRAKQAAAAHVADLQARYSIPDGDFRIDEATGTLVPRGGAAPR